MRHGRNQRSYSGYVKELSEEDRLIKHILNKYSYRGTLSRPVNNYHDAMKVYFGLQLIQIIDLDEKEQVLTIMVWADHVSVEHMLMWDCECSIFLLVGSFNA